MSGPYAHITLLYELIRPGKLECLFSPASGCRAVLEHYFPYCMLGAVSPDYPNLAKEETAAQWAEVMHCTRTCEMISSGIRVVRQAKGAVRGKQLAWLLGYCAHMATDVTIHPIVQAKVGVYAENQRQHRICEMNQDSYIYRRMNLGEIGESDLLAVGIAQCSNFFDRSQLDHNIATLWEIMLADVHPELFNLHLPDINGWHGEFTAMVAGCSKEKLRLFPLAGVIAAKMEQAYPLFEMVDQQFVEEQLAPLEKPDYLHYDDIFDHAVDCVAALWREVERAVCSADPAYIPMTGDWNLDSGRNELGRLVFWE